MTSIGNTTFYECKSLTSIEIPGSVTSIGRYAFYGCESLTSIEVPGSVTSIEDHAFSECKSLTRIEISSSVTSIGEYAFESCVNLTNIKLSSGLTSIGQGTFSYCKSLVSISIPSSVTSIGKVAFHGCSSLTDIYYGGSQEQWNQNRAYQDSLHGHIGQPDAGEFVGLGIVENRKVVVHFNSDGPTDTSDQTITAKNITKTYGAKPFSLNAKVNTGTALTYAVSDKKVATVDKKGKVTIKGCGITNITITAPGTDTYNQATKTIKLTVKPKKVTLSSVKSTKKKTATVKWKQDKKASGYLIQCATDSKFKKNKVQVTVSKNKTVSATVKKLKAGKKYYVRVCAYAKSGKTKVQGDWSKVKTVKVKK